MGSDIHYLFQKKDSVGEWEDLDLDQGFHKNPETGEYEDGEYYIGRDYLLFAALAGVRNGYGFAGTYRHDPIEPIAKGRGKPDDFRKLNKHHWSQCDEWLGDHSFTWATGEEILNWFEKDLIIKHVGIISTQQYDEWDRKSEIDNYSGGVCGKHIEVYDETNGSLSFVLARVFKQHKNVTHVRVSWDLNVSKDIDYFREMVQKLVSKHGEIRMVMGFDS